ncbi:Protein kinase domain [Dillenia turbinata]|uniref:non-specific serine/threonine protein kinase n=1 Tax=Dillenia turbinata TaxID=194707 RepID=A0AAN8Z8I7_9MAGN
MAVAKGNSNFETSSLSSFRRCNCYRVASLSETILESNQISDLKDRYILGEQLGWGQFGVIRACTDKLTGELLACKSIAKDRLVTQDDVRSVKLEIEIMTKLSGHPNVVDLKAVYEEENYVHLVMELCAGGELFHKLEKHGRFSEAEARFIFKHLMEVVMYCHDQGIVHRDLKPENILLATRASSSPIKLADFGLATYIKPGQRLHGTVGSPFYIAPEVLSGGYNQAADVWSAGVILYILLSGMPPFWGKTKSRIFDAVRAADFRFPPDPWDCISELAKELIRGMLSKDSSQRLTVQQVLDHSWMMEQATISGEHCCQQSSDSNQWYSGGSFSTTSFMARDQDVSFGAESPIPRDPQSPTVICRSSFSSFLMDPSAPQVVSDGFSFQSYDEPHDLVFSTPMTTMPSFTFFSPDSVFNKRNDLSAFSTTISAEDAVREEPSLGKLFLMPYSSLNIGIDTKRTAENKRASGSRMLAIHNKRNHTIGLGELEQLDLMVTESVIRWSSCTNLPTASSFRSSLVC